MIQNETHEIEKAKEQGLLTVQEIQNTVRSTKLTHLIDDQSSKSKIVQQSNS